MKNLAILLIDDELDITEILALLLSGRYTADFVSAHNGKDAVKILNEAQTHFDLIFCDFNMPNGNGKFVLEELRKKNQSTSFVLLTSDNLEEHPEFINKEHTFYLQKPFDEDGLCAMVETIIKPETTSDSDKSYLSISLSTLLKIQKIAVPLYVKINESKYLKIINEGILFNDSEYEKYKQKNLNSLHVLKDDFSRLVIEYKTKTLSDMFFNTYKSEGQEEFTISASINEIINSSIHAFGFTEQAVEVTKENIKFVKAIVDRKFVLHDLLRWLENNGDYKYELTHSLLICYITSAIAQKFTFVNTRATELIALAAFFHDISLESYQIENEPKFREALKQGLPINKDNVDLIRKHPAKSAEMLAQWNMCPKEVLTIIENHCERPDGKGFPNGILAHQFDELTACFIFCEDLANYFLASRNKNRILEFISNNSQIYSEAPFKNFLEVIRELVI
jgi:response regulator RpfG family c-di-GMP phosphodiesterase